MYANMFKKWFFDRVTPALKSYLKQKKGLMIMPLLIPFARSWKQEHLKSYFCCQMSLHTHSAHQSRGNDNIQAILTSTSSTLQNSDKPDTLTIIKYFKKINLKDLVHWSADMWINVSSKILQCFRNRTSWNKWTIISITKWWDWGILQQQNCTQNNPQNSWLWRCHKKSYWRIETTMEETDLVIIDW